MVWFVLGYALYAMVYGALGSLASRTEDAQSVAGPVSAVLIVGYFASFAAIGQPDSGWAQLLSLFPLTAPLAMPNRIAMGVAAWWEPMLAVVLTLAAIAALVQPGGRVYARAILHTGPTLRLRDAWRGPTTPPSSTPDVGAHPAEPTRRLARATSEPSSPTRLAVEGRRGSLSPRCARRQHPALLGGCCSPEQDPGLHGVPARPRSLPSVAERMPVRVVEGPDRPLLFASTGAGGEPLLLGVKVSRHCLSR